MLFDKGGAPGVRTSTLEDWEEIVERACRAPAAAPPTNQTAAASPAKE